MQPPFAPRRLRRSVHISAILRALNRAQDRATARRLNPSHVAELYRLALALRRRGPGSVVADGGAVCRSYRYAGETTRAVLTWTGERYHLSVARTRAAVVPYGRGPAVRYA